MLLAHKEALQCRCDIFSDQFKTASDTERMKQRDSGIPDNMQRVEVEATETEARIR